MTVRTFEHSGDTVSTPVWPVVINHKLYFGTPDHTYKVKRIRGNPKGQIAACDAKGKVSSNWVDGTATLLSADQFVPFKKQLDTKYKLSAKMIGRFAKIRRWNLHRRGGCSSVMSGQVSDADGA